MKGGERLKFCVQGREYRFGMQIGEQEVQTVARELNKRIGQ